MTTAVQSDFREVSGRAQSLPKNNEVGKNPSGRAACPPSQVFDGAKFGKLTVIGEPKFKHFASTVRRGGKWRWVVSVACECGVQKIMLCQNILISLSCGCVGLERRNAATSIHGGCGTSLYSTWAGMLSRCRDKGHKNFRHYGGRGIVVCDEWQDFTAFRDWAEANDWQLGLEVDRKDNDAPYSPGNCRIVTHQINNRNKRTSRILTAFGESKCLIEWTEDHRCVVSKETLTSRLRYGWDFLKSLTTPPLIKRHKRSTTLCSLEVSQ